jgi:dienelactone hydrolase
VSDYGHDIEVELVTADGWRLGGLLRLPPDSTHAGVVLVHGSHHERDAFTYGLGVPEHLAARGIASLRFDIRGRGTSRNGRDFHSLSPVEQRGVVLDVAAALDALTAREVEAIGVVGEQDTAASVARAITNDERVRALVLVSPRLPPSALDALRARPRPTFAMVSKEDRESLRDATAAYLAGAEQRSRLEVFSGLGFGTTMFMARAFEQKTEQGLEEMIADWLGAALTARQ